MHENGPTLVVKLALVVSGPAGNVAIKGLRRIVRDSRLEGHRLSNVLRVGGADAGRLAGVRTGAAGGGGPRPDLVAFDESGSEQVVIAAKSRAGRAGNRMLGRPQRRQVEPASVLALTPRAAAPALGVQDWTLTPPPR